MRSSPLTAAAAVLLAIGLAAGCRPQPTAPEAAGRRVDVEVATVAPADFAPALTLTGEVRARSTSNLSFRTGGRLVERLVDVGDHVARGQLLARLDDSQQRADVANGEAAVAAAEAALRQAQSAFERQKTLLDKGFTTQSDFDSAQKGVRVAESSLDGAKTLLDIADTNLGYTRLVADADGIVVTRAADVGEVAPAAGTVFTVALDGPRDAVFDVYEQLFLVHPDPDSIRISLVADPSVVVPGKVREVAPTVDATTGTVRVKIDIGTPPAAMALGAPVAGHASSAARPAVLLPWTALAAAGGKPAVWIVSADSETVELRPVGVLAYQTDRIVVIDGLAKGERVVTSGGKFLAPGTKVRIEEAPAS